MHPQDQVLELECDSSVSARAQAHTHHVAHVTLTTNFPPPVLVRTLSVWTPASTVKMVLSLEAPVFLDEHVFQSGCGRRQTEVWRMFPEAHVPHLSTVQQPTDKFRKTASVSGAARPSTPRVLTANRHKKTCNTECS